MIFNAADPSAWAILGWNLTYDPAATVGSSRVGSVSSRKLLARFRRMTGSL
jgi:hypothetical protein